MGSRLAQIPRVIRRAGARCLRPRQTKHRRLEGNALTGACVKVLRTTSGNALQPASTTGEGRAQAKRTRARVDTPTSAAIRPRTRTTITPFCTHQTGKKYGSDDVNHGRAVSRVSGGQLNRGHTRPGDPGSTWLWRIPPPAARQAVLTAAPGTVPGSWDAPRPREKG